MSKYHARKVTRNGRTFDSAKEARRFGELSLLQRAGEISDLRCQVKYILIPAQREPDTVGKRGGTIKGKMLERECAYIADFVYKQNGVEIVEDVKGYRDSTAYALFTIKRKLMLWVHGIKIKEV